MYQIICLKANRQLSALTRVVNFKAFVESQFKSYPLVWMFNGGQISDKKKTT